MTSPQPLHKQYIIVDANCRCPESIGIALRMARVADKLGVADIKLLKNYTLDAETYSGDKLHAHRIKRKKLPPRDPSRPSYRQVEQGYEEHTKLIVSDVDTELRALMCRHLVELYRKEGDERFARHYPGKIFSIITPERDIPDLLLYTDLFNMSYDLCLRNKAFRDEREQMGLGFNMADQSLIAWYEKHLGKEPETDVILVSADADMIKKMKEKYVAATGDTEMKRLQSFGLHEFADHVSGKLENWIPLADSLGPRATEALECAVTDIDKYHANIAKLGRPLQKQQPDAKAFRE